MPEQIDLEPKNALKPYKSANPMIWGAVLALIAGAIIYLSDVTGSPRPDNTLLASPAKAAGAFFGFGALLAMFRNWLNERVRKGP